MFVHVSAKGFHGGAWSGAVFLFFIGCVGPLGEHDLGTGIRPETSTNFNTNFQIYKKLLLFNNHHLNDLAEKNNSNNYNSQYHATKVSNLNLILLLLYFF